MTSPQTGFRQRLAAREQMLGTVVKLTAPQVIEILGEAGLDFVMIDAEHAPFDRNAIDLALLAARAAGIDGIVRVPDVGGILSALDCGAAGVIVPHVGTQSKAQAVAAACRYRGGTRGFAASTRAGRYGGARMADHLGSSDRDVSCIAMIEDQEALESIAAIVATEGIDGIFLGRADLTVSMGETAQDAPAVRSAVDRIVAAAHKAAKPICAVASNESEMARLRELGVTVFIAGSDQGFIREGAERFVATFRESASAASRKP